LQTVISYERLERSLRNWEPWGTDHRLNSVDAMVRLFHMGIIGSFAKRVQIETARSVRQVGATVIYHFIFPRHADLSLPWCIKDLADAAADGPPQFELVFSPLFFEYLRLRHETNFIINELPHDG
jgi:hypothetical protein